MISASRFELALKCIGSQTLPQVKVRNQHSDAGDDRHADEEDAINAGDIPEHLEKRWPGYKWRAEVAFAYDVSTGEARELGVGIDRQYEKFHLGAFEVPGTVDAHGVSPDGTHHVVHDKKGFDPVTPVAENPQVRLLTLMVARTYQPASITGAISHEVAPFDSCDFDLFDLDETALLIRETLIAVAQAKADANAGKDVEFNTGRQCRWCDAFVHCPKQRDLQAIVKAKTIGEQSTVPFASDEDATQAYAFWKQVGVLYKRLGESLVARAAHRPIKTESGKLFGLRPKEGKRTLDGEKLYQIVRDRHGQHIADASVRRTAAQKWLEEALKFAGVKSVSAAKEEVLAELDRQGGVSRKTELKPLEYEDDRPALRLVEGGGK